MQRTIVLTCLAIPFLVARADAHALGIECKIKGDVVEIEAYYDDDTPCRMAQVRIEDMKKTVISKGTTDETGVWKGSRPKPGVYLVHVNDGAGHLAKVKMTIAEEPSASATADPECDCPDHGPVVSEGPSRTEFTRFPWVPLSAGLVIIGGLAVGSKTLLRKSPRE